MKHRLFTLLSVITISASCVIGFAGCELFGGGQSNSSGSSGNQSNSGGSSGNQSNSGSSGSQSGNTTPEDIYIGTPTPITFSVRSGAATITDSGREHQQMDKVPFSDYYNASRLNKAGYTKLKVTLTLDVAEIDDGYQYIFLYYNSSCKGNNFLDQIIDIVYDEDPSLLDYWKFEHTPGKADTAWESHTFTTSLQMSAIKDDLYIRYGASGRDGDTWKNKNVTIILEPFKP